MAQTEARPVPAKRTDLVKKVDTSSKTQLVQSFVGFNYATVTDHHMQLARTCIEQIKLRDARYDYVPFTMVIQWNEDKPNSLSMIAQAFDLLLKYVINLLKHKRPQVWRSIKTTNSHFCARVDCMVGARQILEKIGYSDMQTDPTAMQFPDHVKEPDKNKLHVIAAELLMAKLEAELMHRRRMNHQTSEPEVSINRQLSNPSTPNSTLSHGGVVISANNLSTPPARPTTVDENRTTLLYTDTPQQHSGQQPLSHSGSGPPSLTQRTPPNSAHHSLSSTNGGNYQRTIIPEPSVGFTPIGYEEPSVGFTPIGYEEPIMRNAPQTPQIMEAPPISSSSPPSDHSSDEYTTPPSTSPNTTAPLDKSCGDTTPPSTSPNTTAPLDKSCGEFNMSLQKFRKKREAINEKLNQKSTTESMSTKTPRQQAQHSSTAVHDMKASSGKGFKPPPTIEEAPVSMREMESQPVVLNSTLQMPPSEPISGSPCPHCGNIVVTGHTMTCSFCNKPVTYQHPTSSVLPPPIHTQTSLARLDSEEPKPKPFPMRASAASTQEAIEHHRRTRVIPAGMAIPSPTLTPGVSAGASEGVSSAMGRHEGAVGRTMCEKTYSELASEKFEAWKKEWKNLGYSDDEIPKEPGSQLLPGPKRYPPRQEVTNKRAKALQKKKDYDPSKDSMHDLEKYKLENQRRQEMDRMGRDGDSFMNCVKVCVQYSYALEEVDIAYKKCREGDKLTQVLAYLQQDWAISVREVQKYVMDMVDHDSRNVGCPSELEARKHLVLCGGNVMKASQKLYAYRKTKIEQLQLKFKPYFQLEWQAAVLALSLYEMDIEKAACSIQCETLEELYEFIFSEWKLVPAKDMANIKERLKKSEDDDETKAANLRMLMGEFKLETTAKAMMVLDLMNQVEGDAESENYPLSYYVEAAKDFATLEEAKHGLIKECPFCGDEKKPVHEMITMPGCTDSFCKECFKINFSIAVSEKGVKHFNCPMCSQPDMTDLNDGTQDLYQQLFVQLIKEHIPEHYDLALKKLAERNLQKEAGFRWCVHEKCDNCFINPNLERKKIQCPYCNGLMCFQCQKPWEDQHNGLTCQQYGEWKIKNDPKFQKEGLAAHLQANGIECPDCHMRYELARGGCMHFKCTRCPNEFCSGCGGSFKKAEVCGRFESCRTRGLHAHHPRDCLYYMRDFSVEALQGFLRDINVEFETEPAPEQVEAAEEKENQGEGEVVAGGQAAGGAAEEGEKVVLKCSAMLQKELVDKLVDEACGDKVKDGHAGLCEKHYKEYLVDRINKAKLDPLPLYDNIEVILKREDKPVPEREDDETDEHYRERLIAHVKRELPLQRGQPDVPQQAPAEIEPAVVQDVEP